MPCVGVFAVRLNFPLSSGEKLTLDAWPVPGSVTVQFVLVLVDGDPGHLLRSAAGAEHEIASVPSVQLTWTVNSAPASGLPPPVTAFVIETLPKISLRG